MKGSVLSTHSSVPTGAGDSMKAVGLADGSADGAVGSATGASVGHDPQVMGHSSETRTSESSLLAQRVSRSLTAQAQVLELSLKMNSATSAQSAVGENDGVPVGAVGEALGVEVGLVGALEGASEGTGHS